MLEYGSLPLELLRSNPGDRGKVERSHFSSLRSLTHCVGSITLAMMPDVTIESGRPFSRSLMMTYLSDTVTIQNILVMMRITCKYISQNILDTKYFFKSFFSVLFQKLNYSRVCKCRYQKLKVKSGCYTDLGLNHYK